MVYAVQPGLEVGIEVVNIGEIRPFGVLAFFGGEPFLEELNAPHLVLFGGVNRLQPSGPRPAGCIGVGQHGAVHLDGEVLDMGMHPRGVELPVVVVGGVGLETHQHPLALLAGIPEFVIDIHMGEAVIHQADGEDLFAHADVRLHEGDELVAFGEINAIVGISALCGECQQQAYGCPPYDARKEVKGVDAFHY